MQIFRFWANFADFVKKVIFVNRPKIVEKNLRGEIDRVLGVHRAETRAMRGPLKFFFLDGDSKERAPKGRCQTRRVWGYAPPENFAEFDPYFGGFLCVLSL